MSRTKTKSLPHLDRVALRLIPIAEQFDSAIVAAHMVEISRLNEELRQWRKNRMGKRVVYRDPFRRIGVNSTH